MENVEIKLEDLEVQSFIDEQCRAISAEVGDSIAVNALSGGVDSSVVSMLGHRALGDRLKTYFIDNGIMREGEPEYVAAIIEKCGVPVELVDAQDEFFAALKGKTDPEEKRHAITETFYRSGGQAQADVGRAPTLARWRTSPRRKGPAGDGRRRGDRFRRARAVFGHAMLRNFWRAFKRTGVRTCSGRGSAVQAQPAHPAGHRTVG